MTHAHHLLHREEIRIFHDISTAMAGPVEAERALHSGVDLAPEPEGVVEALQLHRQDLRRCRA